MHSKQVSKQFQEFQLSLSSYLRPVHFHKQIKIEFYMNIKKGWGAISSKTLRINGFQLF